MANKSPSKMLRDRMFIYYSNKYKGDEFDEWYAEALDKIGKIYLNKVNQQQNERK